MKYFLDTEFHEYKKQPKLLGINVGKPIDTIELISIGIIGEDIDDRNNPQFSQHYEDIGVGMRPIGKVSFGKTSREYYAICKDFDLKAAWDNEWLRENVLKPIHTELCKKVGAYGKTYYYSLFEPFTKSSVRTLLKWFGKTREQIAEEITDFVKCENSPEFYAYYADYDWVVFCWLFGRMIDLPNGFPMYCKDLKQDLDAKCKSFYNLEIKPTSFDTAIERLKLHKNYPKQTNEHNALADAKWNKELYKFITNL